MKAMRFSEMCKSSCYSSNVIACLVNLLSPSLPPSLPPSIPPSLPPSLPLSPSLPLHYYANMLSRTRLYVCTFILTLCNTIFGGYLGTRRKNIKNIYRTTYGPKNINIPLGRVLNASM